MSKSTQLFIVLTIYRERFVFEIGIEFVYREGDIFSISLKFSQIKLNHLVQLIFRQGHHVLSHNSQ